MKVIERSVLKEALLQYIDEEIAALPESEEDFSPEHERRMAKLFARSEKPYYRFIITRARRVAVMVVAILLSLSITVTSVTALREGFVNFVVTAYEKFSRIFVSGSGEEEIFPTAIETKYAPTEVPDGYVLVETTDFPILYQLKYTDPTTGNSLHFKQIVIEGTHYTVDTEGVVAETVMLGEIEALYYANKGMGNILWMYQGYSFRIIGAESLDLLKIAASVVLE